MTMTNEYQNQPEGYSKAFKALLAYDLNCIAKYDRGIGPSITPVKGERMEDFAERYGTSVRAMKQEWLSVEHFQKTQLPVFNQEMKDLKKEIRDIPVNSREFDEMARRIIVLLDIVHPKPTATNDPRT